MWWCSLRMPFSYSLVGLMAVSGRVQRQESGGGAGVLRHCCAISLRSSLDLNAPALELRLVRQLGGQLDGEIAENGEHWRFAQFLNDLVAARASTKQRTRTGAALRAQGHPDKLAF